MGKRIKYLEKINESLGLIMDGTRQLIDLVPKIKDKSLKTIIGSACKDYAKLNQLFSLLLLAICPDICKKDKIDKEFNKLMKPLEKEFGELNGN